MVIRISGNQGAGYQGIRISGKRIDADFADYAEKYRHEKDKEKLDADYAD